MDVNEALECMHLLKHLAKLKIEEELALDHVVLRLNSKKIYFLEGEVKSRSRCKYLDFVGFYCLQFKSESRRHGEGFLSVGAQLDRYDEYVGVIVDDIHLIDGNRYAITPERLVAIMSASGIDDLRVRIETELFNKV